MDSGIARMHATEQTPCVPRYVGAFAFVALGLSAGCAAVPPATTKTALPSAYTINPHQGGKLAVLGRLGCAIDKSEQVYCWYHASDASKGFRLEIEPGVKSLNTTGDSMCAYYGGKPPVCWDDRRDVHPLSSPEMGELIWNLFPLACRLSIEHKLSCWKDSPSRGAVFGVQDDVIAVTWDPNTPCALGAAGQVRCWNLFQKDQSGQLIASDDLMFRYSAAEIPLPHRAVQLVPGKASCALTEAHEVYCWWPHQLNKLRRVNAPPLAKIFGGKAGNCGIDLHGATWCWGNNLRWRGVPEIGELNSASHQSHVPQAEDVVVGDFACVGLSDGRAYCWGSSEAGREYPSHCGPPMDMQDLHYFIEPPS